MHQQKNKDKERNVIIPLSGYLQASDPPPEPGNQLPTTMALCAFIFAAGLGIGALSVAQSAEYGKMQELKQDNQQLTKVRQIVCE